MFCFAAILQGADLANAFIGGKADFMHGTVEDRRRRGAKRIGVAEAELAKDPPTPTVHHFDYGKDLESLKGATDGGYTSAMIDGSQLGFSENVELTREIGNRSICPFPGGFGGRRTWCPFRDQRRRFF
ncbi:fructose-bisphosphate aldolase [Peptococcaceae bacterium CEB3]|nr:fructose-bisphosphate aldolase [Peptococcaceae bacterium CEB3]